MIDHVPFCLFLRLVKVWRRVPSRGAKGWRVTVAIVAKPSCGVVGYQYRQAKKSARVREGVERQWMFVLLVPFR